MKKKGENEWKKNGKMIFLSVFLLAFTMVEVWDITGTDIYEYTITETPITTAPGIQSHPAIHGDRIVWEDYRNGKPGIYLYDLATSTEIPIAFHAQRPDIYGDHIVWQDPRSGDWNIYMYDLATSTETQITYDPGYQGSPAIHGDNIVWIDDRNGNMDIYMYNLATSTETQITTNPAHQYWPAIHGDRIVWEDYRNIQLDIYLYDLATSMETQITTESVNQYQPDIHGDRIVWGDPRNGYMDIYMFDLATSTVSRITTDPASQHYPTIHGDRIAWRDERNDNWDIYMYDLSTSKEIPITTNSANQHLPAIYGDRIVWQDNRNGDWDIYLAELSFGVQLPDFNFLNVAVTPIQPGVSQFTATIQNDGVPAGPGLVPIGWEEIVYDIPLDENGNGILVESEISDLGFDLNGDGDILDTFDVLRYQDETRKWDAIISDDGIDIHAYSIFEGPEDNPGSIRTYYLDGKSKLFHLGSENLLHYLYTANDEFARFGLGNSFVQYHPSANFELVLDHRILATDFKINGVPVEVNYMITVDEGTADYLRTETVYIVPDQPLEIDTGQEISFSCTLLATEAIDSIIGLILNWSPDGDTRCVWVPFYEEVSFEAPVDDLIQELPDEAFRNSAEQRKNAFSKKFDEIFALIDAGEYEAAIEKLHDDIRLKCDGSLGGNPLNDWITDPIAQQELCALIDTLIAYLESLI